MNTDPATRSASPSQRPPPSTALHGRDDVDDDDEEKEEERQHLSTATAAILYHLQYVYMKLWLGLRLAVTEAFQKNHDVLEAGKEVQVRILFNHAIYTLFSHYCHIKFPPLVILD